MKIMYFVATIMVGTATFAGGFLLRPVIWPGEEQQETTAEPQQDAVVEVQQQELSAQELAAQGYLSLEALEVRIDDGEVQWYDGTVWHTVDTVEEMQKEDKFYAAQESFREFEEQLKQQLEVRREEQESAVEQGETLLVGQKEEPKPTEKPKPTKPAVTAPATVPVTVPVPVPEPTAQPESGGNSGGGDSGNSGGGNSGGGDSGNSGGGNSGGGDSGNSGGGNSGGGDGGNSGGGNSGGDSGNPGGDGGNAGDSGNSGDGGGDSGSTGDGENMEWTDDYL